MTHTLNTLDKNLGRGLCRWRQLMRVNLENKIFSRVRVSGRSLKVL